MKYTPAIRPSKQILFALKYRKLHRPYVPHPLVSHSRSPVFSFPCSLPGSPASDFYSLG